MASSQSQSQSQLNPRSKANRNKRAGKKRKIDEAGGFVDIFMQQLDDANKQLNKKDNIKLHSLFKESCDSMQKLIKRNFQVKLQLIKQRAILEELTTKNILDIQLETPSKSSGGYQIPHPLLQEVFVKNMNILDQAFLIIKTMNFIEGLEECLERSYSDAQSIITNTKQNYQAFIQSQKDIRDKTSLWCPEALRADIDEVKDNTNDQGALFVNAISKYERNLHLRFNQIDISNYLNIDFSQKWLFSNSNKQPQSKSKKKFYTKQFDDDLETRINHKFSEIC